MKSLIFKIFLVIFLIFVGVTFYLWTARTSTVENVLSEKMRVAVSIDDIQLGFSGVTVKGLEIGTPRGSKLDRSLYADTIAITVSPGALLFGEMIEVDDVRVEAPEVGVELFDSRGTDNNWSRIANNMAPKDDQPADPDAKKVLVKHLLVTDIKIKATGGVVGSKIKEANVKEPLELENIGGNEPLPYNAIVAIITKALMKHIVMNNVMQGLGNITGGVKDLGTEVIKQPKKILEGLLPGGKKATETVPPTDGAKEGGGLLDGLFE